MKSETEAEITKLFNIQYSKKGALNIRFTVNEYKYINVNNITKLKLKICNAGLAERGFKKLKIFIFKNS